MRGGGRRRRTDGASVTLKSREMQSLALCIVSTQAGLTQGLRGVRRLRLACHLAGWPKMAARALQPAAWISEAPRGRQDTFHVPDRRVLLGLGSVQEPSKASHV